MSYNILLDRAAGILALTSKDVAAGVERFRRLGVR